MARQSMTMHLFFSHNSSQHGISRTNSKLKTKANELDSRLDFSFGPSRPRIQQSATDARMSLNETDSIMNNRMVDGSAFIASKATKTSQPSGKTKKYCVHLNLENYRCDHTKFAE